MDIPKTGCMNIVTKNFWSLYVIAPNLKTGDRIELISMIDDPHPIEPGATGTVQFVSELVGFDQFQIAVKWDNGRDLLLVVPPDRYKKL